MLEKVEKGNADTRWQKKGKQDKENISWTFVEKHYLLVQKQ